MKKIYLAGAIDGVCPIQATSWRAEAAEALQKAGFNTIDPTNKMLDTKETINNTDVVFASVVGVRMSDILLVEMNNSSHGYIGTATEMYWAWAQRKPVIIWGTANRHSHFLRYYATRIFDTLEEAIAHIIDWRDKYDQRK